MYVLYTTENRMCQWNCRRQHDPYHLIYHIQKQVGMEKQYKLGLGDSCLSSGWQMAPWKIKQDNRRDKLGRGNNDQVRLVYIHLEKWIRAGGMA